jgi:hypothetical protein
LPVSTSRSPSGWSACCNSLSAAAAAASPNASASGMLLPRLAATGDGGAARTASNSFSTAARNAASLPRSANRTAC